MAFRPKKKVAEPEEVEEVVEVPKRVVRKVVAPVEEEQPVWIVTDVPTDTQSVIYNNETGETMALMEAVVRILNILEEVAREE